MKVKPQLPKGTRDFLPAEVEKRQYIFETIQKVFHKYGYQAIETPAFERLETLTGKYGTEGDKLLFKILNSGNFLEKVDKEKITENDYKAVTTQLTEKGLRYDLTVPLARYVVQHQSEIAFPFKRYHIAPVWRADRPQKGRYQEFYQCDADVIGSTSLLNEVELTLMLSDVFSTLKMDVTIRLNNRKILEGMAVVCGAENHITAITVAIDKLDKIGLDGVQKELEKIEEISSESVEKICSFLAEKKLERIKEKLSGNEIGLKGVEELEYIFKKVSDSNIEFDITLARGLNYYTGTIWEVVSNSVQIGSISGGGRYDNLTEMFGGQNMSGVGISFGIERIYDVLEELKIFPTNISKGTEVFIVHFDAEYEEFYFSLTQELRAANVATEMYPISAKLDKQMKYANAKNIPYVILIGSEEIAKHRFTVKDMQLGIQHSFNKEELFHFFKIRKKPTE